MRRLLSILLTVCLIMSAVTAWAYWTAGSATGGNGAAAVSSVNQGSTPTASAAGHAVTVAWAPTTLTIGTAVNGYTVKRYSGSTAQTILTACTGAVTSTSCVENNVPTGIWTYSVTPLFATNWVGFESAKSSNVVVGNVAPVAVADSYSVAEDAVLTVGASGVLGNDSDANNDPLTAILASGVANGVLSLSANGGFTYTPNPTFNGTDSFSYKANDGTQNSNVVTVTLTVTAVNDAPVNSVPGPQQTPKGIARVFSAATNNPISISDVDAGGATVQVQLNAPNGTVTLPDTTGLTSVGNGTAAATFTGTIANINLRLNGAYFTPTGTFTGAATLQIVTSDLGNTGSGGTLTATNSVTINVNSLGIFTANQDIGAQPIAGSSAYSAGTYTMSGSGADIWNPPDQFQFAYRTMTGDGRLTARVVTDTPAPTSGAAKAGVMIRNSLTTGSVHALMDLTAMNGTEFISRSVDQGGPYAASTSGPNNPYWVRITRVGNTLMGEYSANGTTWIQQGTTQTITMGSTTYVGLVVMSHDNAASYSATFDNVALTTPPTAVAESYATNENATLNVAARGVLSNDTDPESDALTAVLVSGTAGLTLNANGSFAYVPPANFSGAASFIYKANDGVFDSNTVTVNLTVNPANQVPSFTGGVNQSVSQTFGAQAVAGWATAISQGTGDSGQLVDFVATNTNNPLFSVQPAVSATGTLTYTPAGPTGVATVSVNIHDNGGTANGGSDTSAVQTFTITITADTTGPTGGSVDASGLVGTGSRYAASTILSLVLVKGIDPSGVATTGNLLNRATATLTSGGTADGTCGTYGSYTLVSGGTDPLSSKSDTVSDQACYSYQYVVLDSLGHSTTYTSPDIKVDLTAPAAPTLVHSGFANAYWSSGTVVYYRSAASSGSFTTTSTATDTASGIVSYSFPSLGANWTSTPGALGVNTYSWSGAPAVPGAKSITATNNANGVSSTSFTPTADDTAPTAGTISYVNGDTMGTTVSVTFGVGIDNGSGIGTRLLQRASATRTDGICGAFGGFTTVTNGTNPTSPLVDPVVKGFCYMYQYVVADNLGNQSTASSANIAYSANGAYYTFNEGAGTSAADSSGNANTGTLQAAATWTTGKVGASAVNLTGTATSYVDVTPAVIDTSKSYSVSAWFKPTTVTGNQTIASIDGTSASAFYLGLSGSTFRFATTGSDVSTSTVEADGGTAVGGTWYYLVGVHDNVANTISLYVNGTLQSTTAFTSPWQATGHTVIGRAMWSGGPVDFANGAIDEVHFYDRVLTSAELSGLGSDTTGPTGGSVDASGLVGTGARYAASTTLSLVLAKGTDPSGVATTGNLLNRATATLTSGGTADGTCGAFGSYTTVSGGTDPVSPKSDTVSDQACYSYQYVVLDTLGNPTTYTSPDIKVDLTAPAAPSLAHSVFTNTYWSSGSIVYYRSAASAGSFTTTSTATDTKSGIVSYAFPALGTNWTSTPGALGVNTYAWSGAPAVPGAQGITATNNATGVSGSTSFTPTADDTAPSAGTVSYVDGDTMGTSVTVTFAAGTDSGSGIGTRLLQRASATRPNGVCGAFGGFTTVTNGTNPTSPLVNTVTTGNCYKYQYVVADNVGNTQTASSASVATSQAGGYWAFNEGAGTSAADSSGNGNNGTVPAGAWTTGRVGPYALNLTGANFVTVTPPVIDSSQSYSVAAWVKPNNLTGTQTIASIDGTTISPFYLSMSSGVLQFTVRNSDSVGSTATIIAGGTATVGTWTHLVAVYDNVAHTITLYQNGVLQSSTAFNSPWKATGNTVIGRAKWNGGPVDFVNGAIDEVHFYDRALTATEAANLAAQ